MLHPVANGRSGDRCGAAAGCEECPQRAGLVRQGLKDAPMAAATQRSAGLSPSRLSTSKRTLACAACHERRTADIQLMIEVSQLCE